MTASQAKRSQHPPWIRLASAGYRRLMRGCWWWRAIKMAVLASLSFYLLTGSILIGLRFLNPPTTAVQTQRRIESWFTGQSYQKRMQFVPLSRISPHLRHAIVAAEDGRFYQHRGIDWAELEKVIDENLERGTISRGASTITQQLIKNLLLTTRFGIFRKGYEFALVPVAETVLEKERILELYLNLIEWGDGIYGAEAAARFHYGIPASELSREQAARLAACVPAPRRRRPEQMDDYSAEILRRMERMGW